MKVKELILICILLLVVFGLTRYFYKQDEPVVPSVPYIPVNTDPDPFGKVEPLPKEIDKAFTRLGINIGLLPIVDIKTGEVFVFESTNLESRDLGFPLPTSAIRYVRSITAVGYEGSKCVDIMIDGEKIRRCAVPFF